MNTTAHKLILVTTLNAVAAFAQDPTNADDWKTWILASGNDHAVAPPHGAAATQSELEWLRHVSSESDPRIVEQIRFWDSGPPSYRWMEMIAKRQHPCPEPPATAVKPTGGSGGRVAHTLPPCAAR